MYLISRKFHSSFGIPGTELDPSLTPAEANVAMKHGWEW